MNKCNQKDLEKKLRELTHEIDGSNYLFIEYCETCGMPFVESIHSYYKHVKCESCRKAMKESKKWQKRLKRLGIEEEHNTEVR